MVRICFSPVADHCVRSQTQHACVCVQQVLVIIIVIMMMIIIIIMIIIMIIGDGDGDGDALQVNNFILICNSIGRKIKTLIQTFCCLFSFTLM